MKKCLTRLLVLCIFLTATGLISCGTTESKRELLTLRRATLQEVKKKITKNDPSVMPAYAALLKTSDEMLNDGPYSVMTKPQMPPSGDKHDYVSRGTYWWPNPDTPDGLPYVRRDGVTNPEIREYTDATYFQRINNVVYNLGLAYYYSGDEKYAEHAAKLLKVWFLDEATKMNPHLRYGQQIPGISDGRYIGIIDTRIITKMLNGVILLEGSPHWTQEDDLALQAWCNAYNDWLINDSMAQEEGLQHNNHGTYYDVQVVGMALYCGKPELAKKMIEKASFKRLDSQLARDGEQPHEFARTRPWAYCTMNTMGFTELALLADRVGLDMWHYETPKGATLQKAIEWFFPFVSKEQPWPKPEINGKYSSGSLMTAIAMGLPYYGKEQEYAQQIHNLINFANDGTDLKTSIVHLTHPFE